VHYRDSLQDQGDENISEAYNLILANPPFKGAVDFDIVAPDLLRALGKNPVAKQPKPTYKIEKDENGNDIKVEVKKKKPTEKSELLFLALILRMLKVGGRAAVIIPDGVLFGSTKAHKTIRQKIVQDQKLEAVISLPSGVFKPYAGVSTAILIFTKTNSGGTDKVWFYDMQADGYSLDDKRSQLSKDGEVPTHEQSNIADIIARFKTLTNDDSTPNHDSPEHKRKKTEQSFMVPVADITNNDFDLSINRYKEVVYEEVQYDAPQDILKRIKELQDKMAKGVAELESLL
jgi:type I restriction enzyme M protein